MPTYRYRCEACGREFDAFQKMSDDPLKDCPECGKAVSRVITGGMGVIFKGKGFYQTDYKNDSSGDGEKKNGKDPGKGGDGPPCGRSESCSCCDA